MPRTATRIVPLALWTLLAAQPQDSQPRPTSPQPAIADLIDSYFERTWRELSLHPSVPADDAEFLRRVYLDIAGHIPTVDEARQFLSDRSPDKRARLVDRLLTSDDYARYWSFLWMRILRTDEPLSGPQKAIFPQLQPWLQEQFARNQPWDEIVRDLLTAQGSIEEHPEIAYLAHMLLTGPEGPMDAMQNVSAHLLGYSISCARCHDHPFARWTQRDFLEWSAYLEGTVVRARRLDRNSNQQTPRFEVTLTDNAGGRRPMRHRMTDPETGQPARPRFLGSDTHDASPDRRASLARRMTDPGHLQFARTLVNRYWTILFGRGLVHPADGFQDNNPPAHPQLLDDLARRFIQEGYDLRALLRGICLSQTYQRSCRLPPGADQPDDLNATHARMRPMTPVQLLRSVLTALEVTQPEPDEASGPSLNNRRLLRAIHGGGANPFDVDPDDVQSYKISLQQVLMVMHHPILERRLQWRVARMIERHRGDDATMLEELFLAFLARPPTAEESAAILREVRSALPRPARPRARPGRPNADRSLSAWVDVAWALMNSSEFLFNH